MENKLIFDLKQQLTNIDIDSIKLDAIIQLKKWEKKMFSLIENIYSTRLNEIDEITLNIINEIKEKQNQLEQDKTNLFKLQNEIDEFKTDIIINQTIPEDFHQLIEQTICIKRDDDDDDDFVIIDIDKNEEKFVEIPLINSENCISKIFHSEPVQQALAVSLANALTRMGTMAATSTTTIAATIMAKKVLLTTAYGIGKITMGTTKKVWAFVISSNDV
jgi:hypothetical protein